MSLGGANLIGTLWVAWAVYWFVAALNVNTSASETTLDVLVEQHLPRLLQTAAAISADWARLHSVPQVVASASS